MEKKCVAESRNAGINERFSLEFCTIHGEYRWYVTEYGERTIHAHTLNEAKKLLWKCRKDTINLNGPKSGNVQSSRKPRWLTGRTPARFSDRCFTK